MAKKLNLKVEKAKRNQEYALQFKKRKKRPRAARPAPAPEQAVTSSLQVHEVVCSTCGVETTVPFKPTQGRPVLCRGCFLAA